MMIDVEATTSELPSRSLKVTGIGGDDRPRRLSSLRPNELAEMVVAGTSGLAVAVLCRTLLGWQGYLSTVLWWYIASMAVLFIVLRTTQGPLAGIDRIVTFAIWSLGNIAGGAGVTVSMPMVPAAVLSPGRLINVEAIVTADSGNQSVVEHTVTIDTDNELTLEVDEDRNAGLSGEQVVYNLTYGNRGLVTVSSAQLSFPLPSGTTLVSAGGGTSSGTAVSWDLGPLLAGQGGRKQIILTVKPGAVPGSLLSIDSATLTGSGAVPERARATSQTRVDSAAPLGVAFEVNPDPVRSNELVRSAVTVTNRSGSALFNVTLRVRIPAEVNDFAGALLSGGGSCSSVGNTNCENSGDFAIWSLGNLAGGAGVTVSLPMIVTNALAPGRLINQEAFVTADGGSQSVGEHTIVIDTDNALNLEIDDDRDAVLPGELLTYSLTYGNRSGASVSTALLTFPIPAGTTLSSSTGGTTAGGIVSWNLGTLVAGQGGRHQVVVTVDGDTPPGTILRVNSAVLTGGGLVAEVARATSQTRVDGTAALGLAIEMNPDPVRSNERLRGAVTITNRTGSALFNVTLRVRIPAEVNDFGGALLSFGGSCSFAGNSNCENFGDFAVWSFPVIAAGGGYTLTMPMVVTNAIAAGRLINIEAFLTADGGSQAVVDQTVLVDTSNALNLEVDDDRDAVLPGETLTYTLTFGNRSLGSISGGQLTFPIPVGTSLVSHTGGTVGRGLVTWNLGPLAAGSGGRRLVRVSVPAAASPGTILPINNAVLTGTGFSPQSSRATARTRIDQSRTQGITLSAADPVQPAQTLSTSIAVRNDTGSTLFGVVLRVRIPAEVNVFAGALLSPGGSCSFIGNSNCENFGDLATWSLGNLAAGAGDTVTMPPIVAAGVANGRLIPIEAEVREDSGTMSHIERTSLVGPTVDGDADTIPDVFDNCLGLANPTQLDADGDGFGNICDADLNNSGIVTTADFGILRAVLNQPASASPTAAAADLNGSGTVTTADFAILRARLNAPPGPSALAP